MHDALSTIATEFTSRPLFWLISFVMLGSAFLVVTLKNIFHCALFLVLTLFCVAGMFILLGAEFLAAAQVLIYVGAVAILMIFAIMLTENISNRRIRQTSHAALVAALLCALFAGCVASLVGSSIGRLPQIFGAFKGDLPAHNVALLGKYLMTEYMLPFEVISILLLAAMIGAIVLASKESA